jgi:hypothetical protein
MVRVKKSDVSAMTDDELKAAEDRIAGKRSPFEDEPIKAAPVTEVVVTEDGKRISKVGNFIGAREIGDAGTLKYFKTIKSDTSDWTPVTDDEARLLGRMGILIGHDAENGLALIKSRISTAEKELLRKLFPKEAEDFIKRRIIQ